MAGRKDPGPPFPAVTGKSRRPAAGTSRRLVHLEWFSSPPSLENREPPRLSPGFAQRLPHRPDKSALLPSSAIKTGYASGRDPVIYTAADTSGGRPGAADSLGRPAWERRDAFGDRR
ncbi:MAG: hypothetical protein JWO49_2566 [Arthrobacter sp.]|nr:hypothetical protein [Arthrobacter sp.]